MITIAWTHQIKLGRWDETRHQTFNWFWSAKHDRVYHRNGRRWNVYYKSANTRTTKERSHYILLGPELDSLPNDLLPTAIREQNGRHIYIEGTRPSKRYDKHKFIPRYDHEW